VPPTLPNSFVGQKSILRQIVLPANSQTAWGTPVAADALVYALRYDISGYAKFAQPKESTYGQAGATNSFAGENWTVAHKSALEIGGFGDVWTLGWLLAFVMGKEVAVPGTGPLVGLSTHTFNFLDAGTIAQATTVYCQDTDDLAYQLVDMGISQLTITSTSTGALKFKASLMGTGRVVDGILPGMPSPSAIQKLYGSDTQVALGVAGGALTSFYPRVKSWELTIDAGMAEERPAGSGLYASHLTISMSKVKLKMVIAANGTDDIHGWKRAGTMLGATLTTTSGICSMVLTFPNFTLDENCGLSESNGTSVWTLDLGETDILQIGATPLLTASVISPAPSYLELA
jgi:hypothetical protein